MVLQLIEAVNRKIGKGELLEISVENSDSYMLNAIIPDMITYKENGLYIEGDNLVLKINNVDEDNVFYDCIEESYVVKNKGTTYFLS